MFRRLLTLSALAFAVQASAAYAAEAGKAIYVTGAVTVGDHSGKEGAAVQEGELLTTGADGFLYIKTVDNGLIILRPNTQARIAAYHVDTANPTNTRVKLELLKGVASSKSGDAVKLARQNFRFNTPVAAIGVRGTDFIVYTDQDTSRVAVLTGTIVMSGFGGGCRPDGIGPCEGVSSRELSAAQRGQLLQVQRGQTAPQLLQGGSNAPDLVSPPRADEPVAKGASGVSSSSIAAEPLLDVQKSQSIKQIVTQTGTPAPPVVAPPVLSDNSGSGVSSPVAPRQLLWGRWQSLLGNAPTLGLATPDGADRIISGSFVMFATAGREFVSPAQGNIGFSLKDSEAYVTTTTGANAVVTSASLSNGILNIDFGSRAFTTSLDLTSGGTTAKLQAQGVVSDNGRLYGDLASARPGYIDVQGALSDDKGGTAAYVFSGHLDENRTVNGATYWLKK